MSATAPWRWGCAPASFARWPRRGTARPRTSSPTSSVSTPSMCRCGARSALAAGHLRPRRHALPARAAHGHAAARHVVAGIRRRGVHRPRAARGVRQLRAAPRLRRAAVVGRDQPRVDRRRGGHRPAVLHAARPRRARAGAGARRTAGGRLPDRRHRLRRRRRRRPPRRDLPRLPRVGVDGDAHSIDLVRERVARPAPATVSRSSTSRSRSSASTAPPPSS